MKHGDNLDRHQTQANHAQSGYELPEALAHALNVDKEVTALLRRYGDWLIQEAMPAGGLGPNEAGRVWDRHIIDSLAFAVVNRPRTPALDVGTGVGLPGIPLSIAYPDVSWTLVDRSGRRADLVSRAIRVLGLTNATVLRADIHQLEPAQAEYVVSRAVLQPSDALQAIPPLLTPTGVAQVAIQRGARPKISDDEDTAGPYRLESVTVLDGPLWFLIMHRTS